MKKQTDADKLVELLQSAGVEWLLGNGNQSVFWDDGKWWATHLKPSYKVLYEGPSLAEALKAVQ